MPAFMIFAIFLAGVILIEAGIRDYTLISILKGKPQRYPQ